MKSYWINGVLLGSLAIAMTVYEATNGGKGIGTFFHIEGLILVFGGTLTTVFTVYPLKLAIATFKNAMTVIGKQSQTAQETASEIIKFAMETDGDLRVMEASIGNINNVFFREGIQMIIDRLDSEHLEFILKERVKQNKKDYDQVLLAIKGLAKYPPAFGMVGTLAGLVAMMKGLGSSVGAGSLGSAMAIGLTATFYGVAFANLLILPLADNIQYKNDIDILNFKIALKGVTLLKEKTSPLLIQECLNSMLNASQRVDLLGVGNMTQQQNQKAA